MGKLFFVDLTKCTACRGCQVACKQWKQLPAEETKQTGTHQNPPDLTYNTLKIVHFIEGKFNNKFDWVFFPEQCRHCYEPPCMGQANLDDEGAVIQDEATGAVVFTPLIANTDGASVRSACPYDIPREAKDNKGASKCDMCIDRVRENLLPACVLSCPTGCMHFGDEKEITEMANKRLAEVKKDYPDAVIGDPSSVRVLYLFQYDPKKYTSHAIADASGVNPLSRQELFAKLFNRNKQA
ncbi:4Fe-4S dicluster domain-containing protein [Desulfovibrio litoralis]|uniref:Formate dehydrogenase iron-sulfur subunit n=1 Tax=Desulfovibrio litoralis DSM 11393 TaxID=1121455 RepID=A0A1M7RXR1_9BACT|nr:4Fe-4S dicluster domain-containing protein [Desulfovibrio litoralis]SHN50934.1 formate dehydrogenase iron-sulfur subunit [Desulfovibrio litoralis DSM 11393]